MKSLDVVKILMGIFSDRLSVKKFQDDPQFWQRYSEYCHVDVKNRAESVTSQFYCERLEGIQKKNKI